MEEELDMLVVRKVAVEYDIHERTLAKALRGHPIRGLATEDRAKKAVEAYHVRVKAKNEGESP